MIGAVKAFGPFAIASAATETSAIDLSGSFRNYALVVPSMASGGDVRLMGSETLTGTFRTLYHSPNATTAAPAAINVPSSVSNGIVNVPQLPQYVKVYLTSATTSTSYLFSLICNV